MDGRQTAGNWGGRAGAWVWRSVVGSAVSGGENPRVTRRASPDGGPRGVRAKLETGCQRFGNWRVGAAGCFAADLAGGGRRRRRGSERLVVAVRFVGLPVAGGGALFCLQQCPDLIAAHRPTAAAEGWRTSSGAPLAWAQVGRRIGSLEHVRWRFGGGGNDLTNLAWACLWCNTWPSERRPMATDHGGYHPDT